MLPSAIYLGLFCQPLQKDYYIMQLHWKLGLPIPSTLTLTPVPQNFEDFLALQNVQSIVGANMPTDTNSDLDWIDIQTTPLEGP